MADIPGAYSALNDIEISSEAPLTEVLLNRIAANINQNILQHSTLQTVWTATGSYTVPAERDSHVAWVIGIGGGGGGAGNSTGATIVAGNGGNSGTWGITRITLPASGTVITVTIGGGGAAGSGAGPTNGGDGGASAFGSLATFQGGFGGLTSYDVSTSSQPNMFYRPDPSTRLPRYYNIDPRLPGFGSARGGVGTVTGGGLNNLVAESSGGFTGGAQTFTGSGGGGGASPFANGGAAGTNAAHGVAGTLGSGGGAGGTGAFTNGATGGNGMIILAF